MHAPTLLKARARDLQRVITLPWSEKWAGTTGDTVPFSPSSETTMRGQPEGSILRPGCWKHPYRWVSFHTTSVEVPWCVQSSLHLPRVATSNFLASTLHQRSYKRTLNCCCFCRFPNDSVLWAPLARFPHCPAHQNSMCLGVHISYFHEALYFCSWQSLRKPKAPKASLIYQGHPHAALIQI